MVFQSASIKRITLTCVGCGSTVTVDDLPENIRNQACKSCGASLLDRRLPAFVGLGATSRKLKAKLNVGEMV